MSLSPSTPLQTALDSYLADVGNARSQHTYLAYRRATRAFLHAVAAAKLATPETPVESFSLEWFRAFLNYLQRKDKGQPLFSPATESLYLTSLLGFVEDYLYAVLPRATVSEIRVFANRRRRKVPSRQPPFHQAAIEKLLAAVQEAAQGPFEDDEKRLSVLRDRALLLTLADSGLRVFEACGLRRSQLNSPEGKVNVIGKGDKEAQVRLSSRALRAIRVYLETRAVVDGAQKKELGTLPLFARHNWASRGKTLPMTTRSAERVIDRWVKAVLGSDALGTITPHTFRHYFVTVVIRGSGGDFQVAQKLARHANIATTQRYAHISDEALDRAYEGIFAPPTKPSS
jgi:site-specific recombinase XerD